MKNKKTAINMTKVRVNLLLMMMTNIGTAIAVFAILKMDLNVARLFHVILNSYTAVAVLLFMIVSILIIIVVYVFHKYRKDTPNTICDVKRNLVSDKVVQMKDYYYLENLRREEEVSLEVKNYTIRTMAPYMSVDHIEFLCANIEGWTKSKALSLKSVEVSNVLSSLDLRHFAWNIGERLGWTGQQRALFIKQTFPQNLQDLEIETIRRNLRQKGTCIIQIDIPEQGDYHFKHW